MDKDGIRRSILAKRDALDSKERAGMSATIRRTLLEDPAVQNAETIFVFVSFGSEVDTHPLIHALLEQNKTVAVPYTERGNPFMAAVRLDTFDALVEGHFGILTPHPDTIVHIDPHTIDTVIVPAVAFDDTGHRIGYGAGFYDRYLAQMRDDVVRIGVCFSAQCIPRVPVQPTDIAVDRLITECGERPLRKER